MAVQRRALVPVVGRSATMACARVAMQILRNADFSITIEVYSKVSQAPLLSPLSIAASSVTSSFMAAANPLPLKTGHLSPPTSVGTVSQVTLLRRGPDSSRPTWSAWESRGASSWCWSGLGRGGSEWPWLTTVRHRLVARRWPAPHPYLAATLAIVTAPGHRPSRLPRPSPPFTDLGRRRRRWSGGFA